MQAITEKPSPDSPHYSPTVIFVLPLRPDFGRQALKSVFYEDSFAALGGLEVLSCHGRGIGFPITDEEDPSPRCWCTIVLSIDGYWRKDFVFLPNGRKGRIKVFGVFFVKNARNVFGDEECGLQLTHQAKKMSEKEVPGVVLLSFSNATEPLARRATDYRS